MAIENSEIRTQRIAKNTIFLYLRMGLSLLVGLFTSRVILQTLGIQDYGIYNVVGGVVGMFALISGSMSSSISRFLTFELGRGDQERLRRVFATSVNVQLIMSIIVVIAAEIIGVWFLNHKMNIPEGRMDAANWVIQSSIFMFIIGLLMSPYNASIISHEKMGIYAYISIFDMIMKLLIVYALYLSPFDKLKSYAILLVIVSLLTTTINWIYCKRNFKECSYNLIFDKELFLQMAKYAGWGSVEGFAWTFNTQGVNILINIFFGVTLNAARGVASTIDNIVQQFVRNFMTALSPQVTKSYASGDIDYMHKLICMGAKYSYFLTLFFLIPLCFETKLILSLWLGIVPDYAVSFTQLSLATTICFTLGNTLIYGITATGDNKAYELVVGCLYLTIFPLTWVSFLCGLSPVSAYVVCLVVYVIILFAKIFVVCGKIEMSVSDYITNVLLKAMKVTFFALLLPISVCFLQSDSVLRLFEIVIFGTLFTFFVIWTIGVNNSERNFLYKILKNKVLCKFSRNKNLLH